MSWSTPGIFNVLDYNMVADQSDPTHAISNGICLQNVINAAQDASSDGCDGDTRYAATILFPGHSDVPPDTPDYGCTYYVAIGASTQKAVAT